MIQSVFCKPVQIWRIDPNTGQGDWSNVAWYAYDCHSAFEEYFWWIVLGLTILNVGLWLWKR